MLYQLYDMQQAAVAPMRLLAEATQTAFQNPYMPVSYTRTGRAIAAGAALIGANTFLINQYDQSSSLLETVADAGLELRPGDPHLRFARGIALGRKAWLFAGSDRGGQRAAAMYSLIITAKLNDVDPQAWLADVLARIADLPQSRLDELLPWNWKAAQERKNAA